MLGELLNLGGSLAAASAMRKEGRRNRKQQQAQFDAQMDESVQRRVKDASAAGIHPLFALGASVGASPTLSGPDYAGASAVGDAIARFGGRMSQRKAEAASIRQAEASAARDEAEAALINSERARMEQGLSSTGRDTMTTSQVQTFPLEDIPFGTATPLDVHGSPKRSASFSVVPTEHQAAGSPGTTPGVSPSRRLIVEPSGQRISIYDDKSGPGSEELNAFVIPALKARWIAEWQIWKVRGGKGARAEAARKWILENTDPSARARILKRLERETQWKSAKHSWFRVTKKE